MKRLLLIFAASAAILAGSMAVPQSAEAHPRGWGYRGGPYVTHYHGYRQPYYAGYRGSYGYPGYGYSGYAYPRYSYGYSGYYPGGYYSYPAYGYRSYYNGPSFYVSGRRGGFYW
jgi:hypothetical protein